MANNTHVAIVFYDVATEEDKSYRKLRKKLMREGFYQLQESLYVKKYNEKYQANVFMDEIEEIYFEDSDIRGMIVSQNMFDKMRCIKGEPNIIERILDDTNEILIF